MRKKDEKALLEDLVKAGSNIRVFNLTPGIGFPATKDRMIQVATVVYSDRLGEHVFVEIVPKYEKHHINFFNCPENRRNKDDPIVWASGADKKRAVVTLSNNVTYNIHYKLDNLPERVKKAIAEKGTDYTVGDLFGINY
jgi:hypothetical protein